ncbi:aminodeoxychorismate/anthranilate synthase component II [Algoriphagus lutimaris]|uniref:anthranilate synthase component II n=1 Tax=Algoriphagus lutimaris TaxID=613197 RepID=UPI00196B2093|nr:aminodeoxychorismate/anthranilate synthase component II [Algoriphagus lutimaris]MBN3520655.1 aminodeoxychorismate/anthranilate synthase component II [Algoriphagus lutimaris]
MILLIDNFDSFSHMLADLVRQTGAELKIVRNDTSLEEIQAIEFSAMILSPGPGKPDQAGNLMEIFEEYYKKVPVLGVCLGHQAIGEFFGAALVKNDIPVHGKVQQVKKVSAHPFTTGLPDTFNVTRYHSLQVENIPSILEVLLETQKGEVMGIAHRELPILGIQYHPEAFLTEYGLKLIQNWIETIDS